MYMHVVYVFASSASWLSGGVDVESLKRYSTAPFIKFQVYLISKWQLVSTNMYMYMYVFFGVNSASWSSGGVGGEELEALQHSTFHKICNYSLMYSQGY
jgi:hypothetical protein